jgi:hypothetical protein
MAASGKAQSPVDDRHYQNRSLAEAGTAEKQNMFGPAFQEQEGFFLYRRRLK